MSVTDAVKRAPKWAWFTAGGIGLGAGAIRIWKNKTTAGSADNPSADTTTVTDMGNMGYGSAGVSPSGVIVPPVIIGGGGNGDQSGMGLGDLQSLYLGATDSLIGDFQTLFESVGGIVQDQNEVILTQASGGSAPTPASQTPVVIATPTPVPSPAPAPAPGPPVVIGGSSQPTTTQDTCDSRFPSYPHHDPDRGPVGPNSCYKTGCNSKNHKTRYYKDGDVNVLTPVVKC